MNKIKKLWSNKWVKFSVVSLLYVLLFVVWPGNLWLLLGLPVIFDIYISKVMYRLFWEKHKERKKKSKGYKVVAEWVEAIVFALVAITFLRLFIYGMFVIPTPSMEKSLMVGDYLLVSKLSYGPAVPNTPISFPLVHNTMPLSKTRRSYVEWIQWPYHRLKGFGHVESGDVVVFNFPAGDTVMLEYQQVTYYDVLRDYRRQLGHEEGYRRLHEDYTVISRPVDKRENYVKRCVGLPGDTLEITGSDLYINGKRFRDIPGVGFTYTVVTTQKLSEKLLDELNVQIIMREPLRDAPIVGYYTYQLQLTAQEYDKLKGMPVVDRIERTYFPHAPFAMFPNDSVSIDWDKDNYGPIWIPKKGTTVAIDNSNIAFYRDIIDKYEAHDLEEKDGLIYIDGKVADSYTFAMDYFFMMGDNRDNSADSRFWGFVPEDHIVGKASFIVFSTEEGKSFPSSIRWGRMFKKIR